MATKKAKTGRPKPVAAKAGVTRNPKRKYGEGGKVCCKRGKSK